MEEKQKYVAFLRGINVGGHHKVPMAELRKVMEQLRLENVKTLLNSGNIIYDNAMERETIPDEHIAAHLEKSFGFPIPVYTRSAEEILQLIEAQPFKDIEVDKDTRLYISFLKDKPERKLSLPWISADESYRIVQVQDKVICSVLDVSVTKTPKGMDALGQLFGQDMTTRNWNTIRRIGELL